MMGIMKASSPAAIRRTPNRGDAKSRTHSRIVSAAGRLIRKKGLAAASVHEVMRAAGLTIGGFYAHFRSKSAMDIEVLKKTLSDARSRWFQGIDRSRSDEWRSKVIARYLSPSHRDRPDDGCPMPAVLSEVARAGPATRKAMAEGFEDYIREFSVLAPEHSGITPRERALATLALCVGGVAIARAVRGTELSDEMLAACAKWALPEGQTPQAR